MTNKELLTWFQFGIDFEEKGKTFYHTCSNKFSDPTLKSFLKFLEKEEYRHEKAIKDFLLTFSKKDYLQLSKQVADFKNIRPNIPLFTSQDLKQIEANKTSLTQLLNKAIEVENEGIKLYSKFVKKEKNKQSKQFLLKLASDELEHRKLIEKTGKAILGMNL